MDPVHGIRCDMLDNIYMVFVFQFAFWGLFFLLMKDGFWLIFTVLFFLESISQFSFVYSLALGIVACVLSVACVSIIFQKRYFSKKLVMVLAGIAFGMAALTANKPPYCSQPVSQMDVMEVLVCQRLDQLAVMFVLFALLVIGFWRVRRP